MSETRTSSVPGPDVDARLRAAFATTPAPRASPGFHRSLERRLECERRRSAASRALHRLVVTMRLYWLAAAVASLLILSAAPWQQRAGSLLLVLGLLAAATVATTGLVGPRLLSSLLLSTIED